MTVGYRYLHALDQMAQGKVNIPSDAIQFALVSASYVPNLATDTFWSTPQADEITGTGYTANGVVLASKTHTVTAANSWATTWSAGASINVGDIVRPTSASGYLFQAATAGTTFGSEPIWPTVYGETVVDNGVVWTNIGTGVFQFSSASPSWPGATFSTRYGVIFDFQTGVAATSPLLVLVDFGAVLSPVAQTFTVVVPTLGWWTEGVA